MKPEALITTIEVAGKALDLIGNMRQRRDRDRDLDRDLDRDRDRDQVIRWDQSNDRESYDRTRARSPRERGKILHFSSSTFARLWKYIRTKPFISLTHKNQFN